MASNPPPLAVEDNADEDFFDKLVKKLEQITKLEAVEESGNQLVALNSFECDSLMHQPENEDRGADVLSDTTVVCRSSGESSSDTNVTGESSSGVKEVGWSAFHADSTDKNGGNGFRSSYSDFFSELGGEDGPTNEPHVAIKDDVHGVSYVENSVNLGQHNEINKHDIAADQRSDVQDLNSSPYWENQYPGWKYDPVTGQWYQVDGYDATSVRTNTDSNLSSAWRLANNQAEVSYLQQNAESIAGTVADIGRTESVPNWNQASQVGDTTEPATNWNQVSQVNGITKMSSDQNQSSQNINGYPPHMVFDPQYPGWYYDTIAQKWQTLESYTASVQSTAQAQDQKNLGGYESSNTLYQIDAHKIHNRDDQGKSYEAKGSGSQVQDRNWAGSVSNYNPPSSSLGKPENAASSEVIPQYRENQPMEDYHGQNLSLNYHGHNFSMPSRSQGFVCANMGKQLNDPRFIQNDQFHVSNVYDSNQNPVNFFKKHSQVAQTSYSAAGRSSAGRPAHALVTFGFGGKLILLKDNSSTEYMSFGSQNLAGGSISVLNLAEVVNHNADASNRGMGFCNYVQALCQQCLPGPLSGGSIGTKELNKWIEERITNPESADMDYRKAEVLRLLLSLLKIACQHYGKLRSPYGTDVVTKESDAPQSSVSMLFASAKSGRSQFSQYGAVAQCLQQMPSEGQMQVTAAEVQSLLVSGRKKEALQCAQDGQLWGAALVLAAQLGDQFYAETVKQMALCQFAAGSPLRTLCLLIAGQPADVFSTYKTSFGRTAGAVDISQQAAHFGANPMLDHWEENLVVITANRTKDDELVLMHLGDCLWKERSDIIAAHICYLVAEANFEPYSDTARMCLVGADHWKFPRTYASPEAIQRTEIYEYSKMLGNSQFVLLPFQPYKLIYAQMLAEVGKISDALKYCQAVIKSLKTGRSPGVETLRHLVLSFEERIKAHLQGGFSANLAPKKLVDKLLNLFDSTAHRVVPSIPPPVPTAGDEHRQPLGPRVSTSQSTMAMSSLVPSLEPTADSTANSNRMTMHTRSASEPDIGKSPRQGRADPVKGGTSLFGRFPFGSQLFQKTVELVLKPRQGRQAKLGELNKFHYDEKLKRWVEEGAKLPTEEAALPPPPTTTVFQNRTSDYKLKSALQSEASHSSRNPNSKSSSSVDYSAGIPPLPPNSNQYSARGRMGVRSRYVDTFNQGGGSAMNLFQSPSAPHVKPTSGVNPKFFIPTPVSAVEQPVDAPPSSMAMQRVTSLNNISNQGASANGPCPAHSRRTASWSGDF